MTYNSTIKSAFLNWGVLILSLGLTSCSALDLARLGKSPPSESAKEQAQKPPTREVMIPLVKTPPSKLPEALTEIQPALDLKKPESKGVRFTMSARGVDIKNVMFALSQEIDQNIVIDPNVNKQATVDLKNVTLEEALESLLPPLHLEYTIDEKLIRVRREQMQTRTFFMNYIISKREGTSVLESSSGTSGTSAAQATSSSASKGNSRSTSGVESSEETDIWRELEAGLKSIVTPSASTQGGSSASDSSSEDSGLSDAVDGSGGDSAGLVSSLLGGGAGPSSTVESASGDTGESSPLPDQEDEERPFLTVNRQAGMILIKDFPDVLLQVAEFIENIEGSVQRQVFIQARIIEITLNDDYKLGLDWSLVSPFTFAHGGGTSDENLNVTGAANFAYGLANGSFNIVVDALSQQGQVSVLSSPKIATLNNQRAVIKVGTDDVFFSPEVTAATATTAAVTVYDVETITIGIILDVVPQINPNGQIMMSINTSITEKSGERTSPDNVVVVPILDVRESNSVVLAQHGQTIVIGGLMKTKKEVDDNSVPILGAIPYFGDFFHWSNETESKTELVIMLTPEIMAGQAVDTRFNTESSRLRNLGYNTKNSQFSNPTFKR
jgi:MSHA biogenesis protein MshL